MKSRMGREAEMDNQADKISSAAFQSKVGTKSLSFSLYHPPLSRCLPLMHTRTHRLAAGDAFRMDCATFVTMMAHSFLGTQAASPAHLLQWNRIAIRLSRLSLCLSPLDHECLCSE